MNQLNQLNQRLWRPLFIVILAGTILSGAAEAYAQTGPRVVTGTLSLIWQGKSSPDDIAVGSDDSIYFGDLTAHAVLRLPANASVNAVPEVVWPSLGEPEGIIYLPDNTLIVADQQTNRLYRIDLELRTMVPVYDVGNKTNNPGIDGIGLDPLNGDILVPDSPTGRILRIPVLPVPGQKATTILSGYKRPTSVAMSLYGTLYICDEYGGRIYRVAPNGKQTVIAEMSLPDDVVLDSKGNVLVNSLQGTIWEINPATNRKTALVVGLKAPHGLALDSHGNVIIADATLNQIYRLVLP